MRDVAEDVLRAQQQPRDVEARADEAPSIAAQVQDVRISSLGRQRAQRGRRVAGRVCAEGLDGQVAGQAAVAPTLACPAMCLYAASYPFSHPPQGLMTGFLKCSILAGARSVPDAIVDGRRAVSRYIE
jgi:hypothetical protein